MKLYLGPLPAYIPGKTLPEEWIEGTERSLTSAIRYLNLLLEGNIGGTNIEHNSIDWDHLNDLIAKNQELFMDQYGINPDFLKRFPNKIVNSGFEHYDPVTMKPSYWVGDGVVTAVSSWEGDVALELEPGQYMEQGELYAGLSAGADPAWWGFAQTRSGFKCEGGAVRVKVLRVSDGTPYLLTDNSDPENPVSGYYLDYPGALNWEEGHRTFYFQPQVGDGRVKMRFEGIDALEENNYIDAVQMEPDFTGRWLSVYTRGPRSLPMSDMPESEEWIESHSTNWNAAGVEFTLTNGYTEEPNVVTGLKGAPADFSTAAFVLVVEHIQETVGGVPNCYSRVKVTPAGSSVPTPTGAVIYIQAVCKGKVPR